MPQGHPALGPKPPVDGWPSSPCPDTFRPYQAADFGANHRNGRQRKENHNNTAPLNNEHCTNNQAPLKQFATCSGLLDIHALGCTVASGVWIMNVIPLSAT